MASRRAVRVASKSSAVIGVAPLGGDGGAEEAVAGLFQRGELVLDVALEAGVGGLHDDEVVEARRGCGSAAAASRETVVVCSSPLPRMKVVGMRLAIDGEALPHRAFDRDRDGGDLRIAAEQEVDQLLGVVLHGGRGGVARDRVDRVLHGVGGQDLAVVAVVVRGVEVAGQQHLHGPLAQVVALGPRVTFIRRTRDFP